MTRVAWFSNSPWAGTGYGQQTAHMLPNLVARYGASNVACISNFGLQGGTLNLSGVQHYPQGIVGHSGDVGPAHAMHHFGGDPGIMITLYDVWAFREPGWAEIPVLASWVPIDHVPVPRGVAKFFRDFGAVPIAMSQFGRGWLARQGFDPLYAPHAIDRAVMKPTPTIGGRPSRDVFGIPEDAYVVGMVAANKGQLPNRKSFPEAFRGFAEWREAHGAQCPRRPLLYVHADPQSTLGIDLPILAQACGLELGVDVMFVDGYLTRIGLQPSSMAALFSSFDVLLQPSMGEGFGIPAIEAQACGVPVIGSDFSAQPELIEAGWVVAGEPSWDPYQVSWLVTPQVSAIVNALQACASRSDAEVAEDAERAQAHADNYEIGHVWREHWLPVLDNLEARLPSAEPISAPPAVVA